MLFHICGECVSVTYFEDRRTGAGAANSFLQLASLGHLKNILVNADWASTIGSLFFDFYVC